MLLFFSSSIYLFKLFTITVAGFDTTGKHSSGMLLSLSQFLIEIFGLMSSSEAFFTVFHSCSYFTHTHTHTAALTWSDTS